MDSFGYLIPKFEAVVDSSMGNLLSVHLEISCPSAGSALSAYPEFRVSVDTCPRAEVGPGGRCAPPRTGLGDCCRAIKGFTSSLRAP